MSGVVTAAVLRNKGCPIKLAALDEDGQVVRDSKGQPKLEEVWLRFATNELVDLEDTFGTEEALERQMKERPTGALRAIISIALNADSREIGSRMVPELRDEYMAAVTGALALAQGVDPTQAAQMIEMGVKAARRERQKMNVEADKLVAAAVAQLEKLTTAEPEAGESPGPNGSTPGPEPAATSTSSGA